MIEAQSRGPRFERNSPAAVRRNKWSTFLRRSIDVGRKKLPVPVQLLRGVRLISNVDRNALAFFQTQRQPRELTVIRSDGNNMIRRQFDRLGRDGKGVIGGSVAGAVTATAPELRYPSVKKRPHPRRLLPPSRNCGEIGEILTCRSALRHSVRCACLNHSAFRSASGLFDEEISGVPPASLVRGHRPHRNAYRNAPSTPAPATSQAEFKRGKRNTSTALPIANAAVSQSTMAERANCHVTIAISASDATLIPSSTALAIREARILGISGALTATSKTPGERFPR